MTAPLGSPPLVSVVIDNYNYGQFLPAAIESALNQTYRPVEVVVVDDGSTDDSRRVIPRFGDRVTPVFKPNGGQASALNAGFARSRGDVVLFLDADDMLEPDVAQRVVDHFRAFPDAGKVQYRVQLIDEDGRELAGTLPPSFVSLPRGDVARMVLTNPDDIAYPPTSGNAFARRILDRILPIPEREYRICADYYLLSMSALCAPIESIDRIGARYRVHRRNHHYVDTLDLERLRRTITLTEATHHFIRAFSGADCASAPLLSTTHLAHRLVSLRLDRPGHPCERDRTLTLSRLGVHAALRRPRIPWTRRGLYVVWFTAMAIAPKAIARRLAEAFHRASSARGRGTVSDRAASRRAMTTAARPAEQRAGEAESALESGTGRQADIGDTARGGTAPAQRSAVER